MDVLNGDWVRVKPGLFILTSPPPVPHPAVMDSPTHLDITAMLKDGRHFAERRDNRIHIIDSLTGNTLVMYANQTTTPTQWVEMAHPEGHTVWVQEGIQPPGVPLKRERTFHPSIIHLLCQRIAEGASLTKICGTEDFPPYNLLRKWAHSHPWIDEQIDRARRDRAEYYRDKAVQEAEESDSRDPIGKHSLRVDTYKWAAGVDHEKYNPKTKIEATVNAPTQIVVHTGIQRDVTVTQRPVGAAASLPAAEAQPTNAQPAQIPEHMRTYDEG